MSMIETNCPAGSSRRNLSTSTTRLGSIVRVSSPKAKVEPSTAPGIAAATFSPIVCSRSSIRCVFLASGGSAFNRPGAPDLLLQHQDAVEQRFGGRRAARNVDVDRHDAVAAAHDRIGVVIVAAAVGA